MTKRDVEQLSVDLGFPKPELELIYLTDLDYDLRVQRPEDPRKLAKMIAEWQAAGLGTLSASRRDNGALICLDGQHRAKAGLANGFADETFCFVWRGLTLQQEAILFRLLNNTTKVGIMAEFPVMVNAGDAKAVEVDTVLKRHKLTVGTPEGFNAIAAALRIVENKKGAEALDWAISVVLDTWGASKKNLDGRLVEALAMIHLHYGPIVDTDNLRQKMTGVAGGVHGLIGKARTIRDLKGGRIQVAMVEAVVGVYNANKRRNLLPEWVR